MKILPVLLLFACLLGGGCRHASFAEEAASHPFDGIQLGMSKLELIEALGNPSAQSASNRLRWEHRSEDGSDGYLEVTFNANERAIHIEDSRTRRRDYRT